jgi:hypothetical protein
MWRREALRLTAAASLFLADNREGTGKIFVFAGFGTVLGSFKKILRCLSDR